MEQASLHQEQIDAIVNGQYREIFAVLGLHRHPSGKGLVLRVFIPGAQQVQVLGRGGNRMARMQCLHPAGLFEAHFARRRNFFDYRLLIDDSVEAEDPYRFASLVEDADHYLFAEGTHECCHQWMGARPRSVDAIDGVCFVVWAPSARRVSVVGDFNDWDGRRHVMRNHPNSGVWEIFIPGIAEHALYKYEIFAADGRLLPLKSDPYARSMQHPPETASRVVFDGDYGWGDADWMARRSGKNHLDEPVSVYEVHLGSWRRKPEQGNRYLSYLELADELVPYVADMGFTHIELMPISEFPFDGSWGYQPIGLFAPTIRHGTPDEFRQFVDRCHQAGIGVILDWVPGHFPTDQHGLGRFDGSCLYEHEDPRKGFHVDWNTLIYNYGRNEVKSYLISNANYWLGEYHLDGLRVDAVASMLYLDYSRAEGQWLPNEHGGRENLEAIDLLRAVNARVYANHPGVMMIAEESTAWPGVSAPVDAGGLGFGYKWNMGWMNDSLQYIQREPIHRRYHENEMTFSIVYAWTENYLLPLSHDEVVHGKGSLLAKMPGDSWQKFANLRTYLAFMWAHPGKMLLFMGCEIAQRGEWNHDRSIDWHLLDDDRHRGVQSLVRDLNRLHKELPAMHRRDASHEGFQWLPAHRESVLAWLRRGEENDAPVVVICNMTPQPHHNLPIGVPLGGRYAERLNSDADCYGGSGLGNGGGLESVEEARDGQPHTLYLTVPPLATVYLEHVR